MRLTLLSPGNLLVGGGRARAQLGLRGVSNAFVCIHGGERKEQKNVYIRNNILSARLPSAELVRPVRPPN